MKSATLSSVFLTILLTLCCCTGRKNGASESGDESHPLPDTLRVATLYSPTSYFLFRDEEMGFDYSLINSFAKEKNIVLDLKVAPSLESMMKMLSDGEADILAYEIPVTAEFKDSVIYCGPLSETTQVLVQHKPAEIKDVTDLVGKTVYVERNSKYQYRLENLNDELGGGMIIKTVDKDTLITEDLIGMVSNGELPLTVVDSDIARINRTYYPGLDISLAISFPQKSQWGASPRMPWLADSINVWFDTDRQRTETAALLKRYFEMAKSDPYTAAMDLSKGYMSVYDDIFRRHAKKLGWDWRLLAAQGFTESHFDTTQVSWAGARGIMQIMPSTARIYGLNASNIANPEANIRAATEIIKTLDKAFSSRVRDPQERIKFILAAYNAGPAHIYDAINIAKKVGLDPEKWDDNVAEALLMKSNPAYFNDRSVCKYGYFRGRQTYVYVKEVFKNYNRAKEKIKA